MSGFSEKRPTSGEVGGVVSQKGRGGAGGREGVCGDFGGGGAKYFFSGPKCPPSNTKTCLSAKTLENKVENSHASCSDVFSKAFLLLLPCSLPEILTLKDASDIAISFSLSRTAKQAPNCQMQMPKMASSLRCVVPTHSP